MGFIRIILIMINTMEGQSRIYWTNNKVLSSDKFMKLTETVTIGKHSEKSLRLIFSDKLTLMRN